MLLLFAASLVVLPFLTYYVTSALFFRKAKSAAVSKEPPTIPYFVPGVFHAAGFARSGARKYFAQLIQEYGTFSPFKVRAGFRSYVILRDPVHISRVMNAPEHLTMTASKIEVFDKLFGFPNATKNLVQSGSGRQHAPAHLPLEIPEATLVSTTEVYISILSANLHDKMFQYDTWTGIEDLWSFLQLVSVRCTLETLFGAKLLKNYPRMVRDYLEFNAATEGYVHGMPRLMLSGATKPRDRIHEGVKTWLTAIETNNKETATDGSLWNETSGLNFIRERYSARKVHSGEGGYKARAAEILSIVHATNSNLVSSTFWTIVETLRKSHLTRNMTDVAGQHLSPITHKYDIQAFSEEPLVKSIQVEVHRLRTATCAIRTNQTEGFPLDKQWSLRKGATVAMFSHDLALNTNTWKKIQPRALGRPLGEFWAERFVAPERNKKSTKNASATSDLDIDDLGELITKLAACDQYPGSHFISTLQMATVAVLFAEFEIQLCDTDEVDGDLPPTGEFAFGTVKPLYKVAVRIRKRRT